MNFSAVAVATSIIALLLGIGWLLVGSLVLNRWRLHTDPEVAPVARRLGAAYIGIALMLLFGRNAPPSDLRSAVCMGLVLVLAALAVLGVLQLKAKEKGRRILVSVFIEAWLAAAFASVLLAQE